MNKNKTRRKTSLGKKNKKNNKNITITARKEINKFIHNEHSKKRNSILYDAAIRLIYNELPKSQKMKLHSIIGTQGSSSPKKP